jgi:nucleoside-diphosphate-sugar epimerase
MQVLEANLIFPLKLLELALTNNTSSFINIDTTLNRMVNPYSLSKKQFLDWLILFEQKLTTANLKLEMLYGPGDRNQNLITTSLAAFLANKPEMDFTPGEQIRDFIYIDDAVDAVAKVVEAMPRLQKGVNEFQVGTGRKTTLKKFLETAKKLTKSKTRLNFGALAYRKQENMCSVADPTSLNSLGWQPRTELEKGLGLTIGHLRQKRSSNEQETHVQTG